MSYRYRNVHLWPDFIYKRTDYGKDWERQIDNLHSFTNQVIQERDQARQQSKQAGTTEEHTGKKRRLAFLDLLLELKDEGKLNYEDIREETDTFMFEGHDTTATGTMWALYCIASDSDVQERLYEEIVQELGSDPNTDISAEQLVNMKYLECVLKESQRIFPSVPLFGRKVTETFEAGGYTVCKGWIANISVVALHHDLEMFPNPLQFDPERFQPDNAAGRHPFAFVPFSAGPRNCIGQRFALMEEKILIVQLLRAFKFAATQKMSEMAPSIELVLRPSNGVWLEISPRTTT
jgi:cytochrome P450 family 4 subfamily V